jgi:hypothetical protein
MARQNFMVGGAAALAASLASEEQVGKASSGPAHTCQPG